MTKMEIAQRIADNHNRLASIFASGGMKLLDADSVILMGDTIKDLRWIAQQVMTDADTETIGDNRESAAKESE